MGPRAPNTPPPFFFTMAPKLNLSQFVGKEVDVELRGGKILLNTLVSANGSESYPYTIGRLSYKIDGCYDNRPPHDNDIVKIQLSNPKPQPMIYLSKYVDNVVNNTDSSVNSKYDSKNPMINNFAFNIGGQRYPSNPLNPLLLPSQSFSECEKAMGSFNNAQFQSCISRAQYCKLSKGGTASGVASTTQDAGYTLNSSVTAQSQFFMGFCLEVCAKRGILSGLNCSSAPVFVENNILTAPTNAHLVFIFAMIDCIFIHDVSTGDISVRM